MLTSLCPHFGICGGCSLQHLSYQEQLASKEAELFKKLRRHVAFESWESQPLADAPWHFRQKVAFVFGSGPRGRGLIMGHYERGSNRIVPVEECPVHSVRGNRIAFALRDQLVKAGITAAGPSLSGVLRHLIVRTTQDEREAVAMLIVTRNDKALRRPVRALLESADRPEGFFININRKPGPFMVGSETIRIDGRPQVKETVGGLSYLISPAAFFQTNVRAAGALQRCVSEGVVGASRVLDLYCGSGLFSLPLAAAGARVVGVEENRDAVRDAEMNLRLNRIAGDNARFVCGRVEEVLVKLPKEDWDAVVLDPPRQGCPRPVLSAVFEKLAPPRAVYVSCNLDALVAELPTILNAGYRIDRIRAVDMFPHTDHIETVAECSNVG
jgi:23S rRNA (uracil1939-C5)-methyltransferase